MVECYRMVQTDWSSTRAKEISPKFHVMEMPLPRTPRDSRIPGRSDQVPEDKTV